MKKFLFFACLCPLIGLMSCNDDNGGGTLQPTNDITLNFKAEYGGERLVMNREYDYEDGTKIKFTKFQFYVSNLSLLQESGEDITEIKEIDLIDFSESIDDVSASLGVMMEANNVPVGSYASLQFGLGVGPELNSTKPSEYGSNHVLSNTSEYWSAWESYIFAKIEGRADLDGDGMFEQGISYHLGASKAYRTVDRPLQYSVVENEEQTINVSIDLKSILVKSETDFFDISTTTAVHEDNELVDYLMDNFEEGITVQ